MSVASSPSSFPCIKLTPHSSPSSPSSVSSSPSRCSTPKAACLLTIRSSQAEGPLRRPVAQPPLARPSPPSPSPPPLQRPSSPAPPPPEKPAAAAAAVEGKNVITLEFQRQKARELQEYFKKKKLEDAANRGPFFGFIGKNEIANGRWAMFGFAVGLLTEYATGSDFVDQVKILLSNFGILDLE